MNASWGEVFSFPNPVNEVAARTVAAVVALIALAALLGRWPWLCALLAAGFLLRTASGPTLSPLGQFATRVAAPRIAPVKLVAGPPKRFAQAMGATLTVAATICYFGLHLTAVTDALIGVVLLAATLESVFALCVGCRVFGLLMRLGLVPAETCAACADLWGPAASARRAQNLAQR